MAAFDGALRDYCASRPDVEMALALQQTLGPRGEALPEFRVSGAPRACRF